LIPVLEAQIDARLQVTVATPRGQRNVTEGPRRMASVWVIFSKDLPLDAPLALHFCAEALQPMSATFIGRAFLAVLILTPWLAAQSGGNSTTTCNLDDGRQVYVRYTPVSSKEKVPNGKPWAPAGTPMTLFTEAPLTLGTAQIPVGAYTVYPIPARGNWTLVVNKNVTPGAPYDDKQDVARATMETAQVETPSEALEVAFAHVGARCTLRIYIGKAASFADFTAK
jgi:hypothetical protein